MTGPEDYSQDLPRSSLSRRRIRSTIFFLVVMVAVAFLIGFLFDLGPEPAEDDVLSDVGDFPAEHIWFNTSEPLSLYNQLSRHVVVIFFCSLETLSDLEYCQRLEELQEEFREQPLVVIASVQTSETSVDKLWDTVKDWGVEFPVIIDNQGMVSRRFNVGTTPALLVLDARARVSARFFIGWDRADLSGIVEDLLQQLRAMRYTDIHIFRPDGERYIPESFSSGN
jgi:peroxiredoxin